MRKLGLIILFLLFSVTAIASAENILVPHQYLNTSGARDITPFTIAGGYYIAVPQLAKDIPNTAPNMNGGDADVDVIIFKWQHGKFQVYQRIPGHGNEGTAFFTIGSCAYLALSSVHSGPKPPYNLHTYSKVYEWDGKRFYPIQQFFGYASKSWYAFSMNGRHFLGLANGVVPPDGKATADTNSMLYVWDGHQFKLFQIFPSKWAYAWDFFTINGVYYLGLTDHMSSSKIYRWNGKQFVLFQSFKGTGGRAFVHFCIKGQFYLAYANISHHSMIYRWSGRKFVKFQTLQGLGGRNFVFFTRKNKHYLFRINFITGTRKDPNSALISPLYVWNNKKFVVVQKIPTFGGVSAATFIIHGQSYLGLANSLSEKLRFRVHSVIYKIQ